MLVTQYTFMPKGLRELQNNNITVQGSTQLMYYPKHKRHCFIPISKHQEES